VTSRSPRPSRVGSFLLVLGFLTVLAASFGAGVGAGRRWPRLLPSLGGAPVAKADRQDGERVPGRRGGLGSASSRERSHPELTFYHELTAPLTAPPPAAKRPERVERPAKAEAPKAEAPKVELPKVELPKVELPRATSALESASAQRFTVQVGAFKTRDQAEAMRARLAGAGHDAYIADFEGPPGARFRVRVGAFATRDEARHVAERLAAERKSATFVTTR
jgi:cell division protein FtsN